MKHDLSSQTLALAMLGLAAATLTAHAVEPTEVITVQAAREVDLGRSSSTGAPIKEISITHRVSFADLDLATPEGAATLETRIRDAAKSGCKELDQRYPLAPIGFPVNCVQDAVGRAMPDARAAIDAAKKR